ncbi:helix-turn-helix transcriptional regulator [Duganella sp. LX20W]|uniref:Helix-turn-helix transcriptional regulator n=1 Tax=Rugamonas brunnea TaxID=2758569 RepID=A0A7W2EXJ0_9BURK|nr:helix-turn-helix transcriptional regulator [Rugamonas brunnea]MBA5640385.1 helix-turn-helix transcriptional regulator [Rugamonas brunnea]
MKSIHRPKYVELIEKLVEARNAHGVTQIELAARLVKPQSYVAKVEALDRRLDVIELGDWLHALGEPPAKFMGRLSWWK